MARPPDPEFSDLPDPARHPRVRPRRRPPIYTTPGHVPVRVVPHPATTAPLPPPAPRRAIGSRRFLTPRTTRLVGYVPTELARLVRAVTHNGRPVPASQVITAALAQFLRRPDLITPPPPPTQRTRAGFHPRIVPCENGEGSN